MCFYFFGFNISSAICKTQTNEEANDDESNNKAPLEAHFQVFDFCFLFELLFSLLKHDCIGRYSVQANRWLNIRFFSFIQQH